MKTEKAKLVVDGLKEAEINFAAGVPDAQFIEVYKMVAEERGIHYVGAANEAEAAGIGLGAWFGGKKPALSEPGPHFIDARVEPLDDDRPPRSKRIQDPRENKYRFAAYIERTEGVEILGSGLGGG